MEHKPRMLKRETGSYSSQEQPVNNVHQMMGHCLSELMNVRTSMHQLHLTVTGPGSYAAHKALNSFYDALPDMIDSLVEGYQGASETLLVFEEMPPRCIKTTEEALAYCREMYQRINKLQAAMPYSEIVNNMDLVKDAINSLKYKLIFLK